MEFSAISHNYHTNLYKIQLCWSRTITRILIYGMDIRNCRFPSIKLFGPLMRLSKP
jgi:hypothetical protein